MNARNEMRDIGLAPNKRFGQNFLRDPGVLETIANAAKISPDTEVLEIGPGLGALTALLSARAARTVAVEIDKGLAARLTEQYAGDSGVEVICGDILKVDLPSLFPKGGAKVVANLPYYITTPILLKLLPLEGLFTDFVVMIQKEMGDRMAAECGSKDYGALSLLVGYYCRCQVVTVVPPQAFYPQPRVMSEVIRLSRHAAKPVDVDAPDEFLAFIRAAFGQRRKTLVNAIKGARGLGITPDAVRGALSALALDPMVRGEALDLSQFAEVWRLARG